MKIHKFTNIVLEATMVIAASALLLAGCAKEKTAGIAECELVEYTLQAEVSDTGAGLDIDTKVALNSDGITPNWESGDQILVLDADKKPVGADGKFTLSSGQGTASGTFSGMVYVGQKPTYAIYPASAATVNSTNPASTAVTAGTLAAPTGDDAGSIKGAVMLGSSSDGTTFTFTNACAVLKINTGDYGSDGGDPAITSVKVSATYGETPAPIAGAFTIDWTNLSISKASSGTVNKLTVALPSELQANGKDIYIPIFPLAMQNSTAPSMAFKFTNANDGTATVSHGFTAAIAANTMKNLGTAGGMEFKAPPYVEIEMTVVGVEKTYKWYKQNLAISDSGKKAWKGNNSSAVKVPGTEDDVINGDYFQWAAHAGYCGDAGDADKGLLIYNSFINTKCVGNTGPNSFDFKSADGSNKYRFLTSDGTGYKGISPYYSSNYKYYTGGSHSTLYREITYTGHNDDVANIILGDNWRMPTSAEFQALYNATYWAWDETDCGYYVFRPGQGTSGSAGSCEEINATTDDKSKALLFFPAASYGYNTSINNAGPHGCYWSSTLCSSETDRAYNLFLNSSNVYPQNFSHRYYGCTVRPVSN